MEIRKFEAFNYRNPKLKDLTRKDFIEQLSESFIDREFFGYTVNGSTFFSNDEVLWLHMDKKGFDDKIIKLDFSDLGIEIGGAIWDEKEEEYGKFEPEINLDTDSIKKMKSYKSTTDKFNV